MTCVPGDRDTPHTWYIDPEGRPHCGGCDWVPKGRNTRRYVREHLGSCPPRTPDGKPWLGGRDRPRGVVVALVARDGLRCYYCHRPFPDDAPYRGGWSHQRSDPGTITIDHRVPLSRGGRNHLPNKVLACLPCNGRKGSLTEAEYAEWDRTGHLSTALEAVRCGQHRNPQCPDADAAADHVGIDPVIPKCWHGSAWDMHRWHASRDGTVKCWRCHWKVTEPADAIGIRDAYVA